MCLVNLASKRAVFFVSVAWFILSLVVSVSNDVLSKGLGSTMPAVQVAFFRFLFSTITLLPFMLYYGRSSFATQRPMVHVLRGSLLFFGITLWCYGLTVVPIAAATVINFTIPLFTLFLAALFLKERVGWNRWFATIVGFIGIYIVLSPGSVNFHSWSLMLLISSFMFAALDVINKKFVVKEGMLSMLFYSALITTILGIIPAWYVWQAPTLHDLMLLFALGAGANLILFLLLKAFSLVDASALVPFRYLEFIMSSIAGYLFFAEYPANEILLGAFVIIPASFFVAYVEARKQKKEDELVARQVEA